ncbi:(S)-ureidoglycine aminohydrolase [Phreatobacter stygius]|uniref:(S)-ureidoglycine aminohydrolase n=1 Tax=Phreatobacter stygius TaxID=1940610 RepID=A0A4D7B2C3_9HYPH|nr:(S)-ureidoglycine aminohydrolase [Phreatobacter stygius]QCI66981.1 (S)-ureidoglycine aminohydrolase [Phreatobacter stygius]
MHPRSLKIPAGRLPPGAIGHNRGVVRRNYAFMPPEGVLKSRLPAYDLTVVRFLAAPVLGAQFAQFVLEVAPGGGSNRAVVETGVQHFLFVLSGAVVIRVGADQPAELTGGGFAYIPPGVAFTLKNEGRDEVRVLALRKRYEAIDLPPPEPIVSHRDRVPRENPTGLEGRGFQYLLPFGDMRFDFEMNLMWFQTGASFPDVETHIMEHGLYMLEGQGLYFLGQEWHEIWAEDFIWMGGFCPQQFYPTGFGDVEYLLYKNVNRDVAL